MGSASPRLSGPTAVMMTCMAGSHLRTTRGMGRRSSEVVLVDVVAGEALRLAEEHFAVGHLDRAEPAGLDGAVVRHLVLVQQVADVHRQVAQVHRAPEDECLNR